MIFKRYSKSMASIFNLKQSFFENNDFFLKEAEELKAIYTKQPLRKYCKICNSKISDTVYYYSHGTAFYLCGKCGHVNGQYEDGEQYTQDLYKSGVYGGAYRVSTYEDYIRRMESIYIPKVQFLVDTLESQGIEYKKYKYLDIGTGVGYMVGGYTRYGLNASGIDVDENQIVYGNKMLGKEILLNIEPEEIVHTIESTECEVLSFINVLEHVVNLQEILYSVKKNNKIKFIYFCVPKLALSCMLEIIFPEVHPRHIGGGGGHTHLFTDESLDWIYNKYEFTPVAKWQFGTDIMDLYRSMYVMLKKNNSSDEFISKVSSFFAEHADAIQMIVDKTDLASDIHVIAKVN